MGWYWRLRYRPSMSGRAVTRRHTLCVIGLRSRKVGDVRSSGCVRHPGRSAMRSSGRSWLEFSSCAMSATRIRTERCRRGYVAAGCRPPTDRRARLQHHAAPLMSRSRSPRPRPDAPSTDAVRATPAARSSAPSRASSIHYVVPRIVRLGPTLRGCAAAATDGWPSGSGWRHSRCSATSRCSAECSAPAGRRPEDALRISERPAPLDEAAGRGGVRHPGEITRNM